MPWFVSVAASHRQLGLRSSRECIEEEWDSQLLQGAERSLGRARCCRLQRLIDALRKLWLCFWNASLHSGIKTEAAPNL